MNTLTKEWLLKTIAELEEERDAVPGIVNEDAAMSLAAMKIALASLEAEAVGEVVLGEYDDCGCHPDAKVVCIAADGQADWENFKDGTRLYTAPPAPVSVPDGVLKSLLPDAEKSEFWFEHDGKILFEGVKFNNAVFDACRAVMLQGADGNSPVIPDGWVACSDRMPEQFKAILAFNEYGEVWSGAYDRYWNFYCDNLLVEHVTHWMPLPNPPKE
ncbi:DUF551 domain-containing protein [Enterobacter cloacae complex sp. P18RS]|uniref:DUF551 domain-containing protein n=1 Tax=Enterobacter cloacae complex sp. P18RS TaxID=2779575 RepID=UPI0018757451|nr:DUF551 domain-containing protein [Enterobacter cloacae complex sp. P18RS]MBE4989772.1 DUF551 domain-containing protein [Enterobacter cloacae complex sp. P18RS]